MNREDFIKNKSIIEAWANGAEVEYLSDDGKWTSVSGNPFWHSEDEYRIKPEPKTVCGWVNIYPKGSRTCHVSSIFYTKDECNRYCSQGRIACVPVTITYTEGEGLDD